MYRLGKCLLTDFFFIIMEDFKSIELCLLAHVSSDQKLISILNHAHVTSMDIFELLAAEWYILCIYIYIYIVPFFVTIIIIVYYGIG